MENDWEEAGYVDDEMSDDDDMSWGEESEEI